MYVFRILNFHSLFLTTPSPLPPSPLHILHLFRSFPPLHIPPSSLILTYTSPLLTYPPPSCSLILTHTSPLAHLASPTPPPLPHLSSATPPLLLQIFFFSFTRFQPLNSHSELPYVLGYTSLSTYLSKQSFCSVSEG